MEQKAIHFVAISSIVGLIRIQSIPAYIREYKIMVSKWPDKFPLIA